MDINTKLNMTFLILFIMAVLFIKIRSECSGEASYFTKASSVIIIAVSFLGFIITSFIRIWA